MSKITLTLLITCIMATLMLTGCKGSGGGASAWLGSSYAGGSDILGGDSPISSNASNPEPATIVLLGGGLAAYAFLRRRRLK